MRATLRFDVPKELNDKLRDYQRRAVAEMGRYVASFSSSDPRAGLVQMPTGAGKTGVIATLARSVKGTGPVLVLTPRKALREQLARDVNSRFFEHADVDPKQLPRRVVELVGSSTTIGDHDDAIVVSTPQLLTSLQTTDRPLYEALRTKTLMVLFDEGHYEPAVQWSKAVRPFVCPRIVFTATPFRNDLKLFDVDRSHWFSYSYAEALKERFVREVRFRKTASAASPAQFAAALVSEYDTLFEKPAETDRDRPRAIIRCVEHAEIRQIGRALNDLGRSVVKIHEQLATEPAKHEYHAVPSPESTDGTFWIHQYKLTEGIDDHRFQLLAPYRPFTDVRQLVQQIGRTIRNPKGDVKSIAYVLDDTPSQSQASLWKRYVDFDRQAAVSGHAAADLQKEKVVIAATSAVPSVFYADGRFRAPAELDKVAVDDLRVPLAANVLKRPSGFMKSEIEKSMRKEAADLDLVVAFPSCDPDMVVAVHARVDGSPLLTDHFFADIRFGVSIVHERGGYVFTFDSGPCLARSAVDGTTVEAAKLKKLFVGGAEAKLSEVNLANANVGADRVRARSVVADRIDSLVPSFDERNYVLRTAVGYTSGRHGMAGASAKTLRRYVGGQSGRVRDLGARFVPLSLWTDWTAEIAGLLDSRKPVLPVFSRWAAEAPSPKDPTPQSILLDLGEVVSSYRAVADGGTTAEGDELVLSDTCASVDNGKLTITANGSRLPATLAYDPVLERYMFGCESLDEEFTTRDPELPAGICEWINQEQAFRVLPKTAGYVYALRGFWRPTIDFGPGYDDSQTGVIGSLHSIPALKRAKDEKGKSCQFGGRGWEKGSLFDLVDTLGAGTGLASHMKDIDVLICDDMNYEISDFVALRPAGGRRRASAIFIHAKASASGSVCGASGLQDVCGQAVKNLQEVSLFAVSGKSKDVERKWSRPWRARGVSGEVKARIRRGDPKKNLWSKIRAVVRDPNCDREIWLLLGNLLEKAAFETELRKPKPAYYAIHAAYLLQATIATAAAAGARLTVFCS